MSRTLAIIQARQTSTRLPGKGLVDVVGKPLVERVVDRVKLARNIDGFVVAIPDTQRNDALADFCMVKGWFFYRGSEDDVLGRYVGAAREFDADPIVRVTADEPFLDVGVIEACVRNFGEHELYTNNMEKTFAHGHDVEVFSRSALIAADGLTQDCYEREHVTEVMRRQPENFRIGNLVSPVDLSRLRLTVDYPQDLDLCRALYLSFGNRAFTTADLLWLFERRPDLQELHARALKASGNVVSFAGRGH